MVAAVSNNTQTESASRKQAADQKNQFLLMLTTQLQHQDPLSPMDSTAMTQQLGMFSQIEQQIDANEKLQALIDLQTGKSSGLAIKDALNYIGKTVKAEGSAFTYDGTNGSKISYSLPGDVAQSVIGIYDKNNVLVRTITAEKTKGEHSLSWDGKDSQGEAVAAGDYTFKVAAKDAADNVVTGIKTYVNGTVSGIEQSDDGVILKIGNHSILIDNVVSAYAAAEI